MGDGFLATFDGPARAVKCAQGHVRGGMPLGLRVRAGWHTGEIDLLGAHELRGVPGSWRLYAADSPVREA